MKDIEAYKTIGEVSKLFNIKPHVIRFWEENFSQLKPLKRKGGRRLYSEDDIALIRRIKEVLYEERYSVKGVKNYLSGKKKEKIKEEGNIRLSDYTIDRLNDIKNKLKKIKQLYEK